MPAQHHNDVRRAAEHQQAMTNHTRSHEAFALPAVTTPEQRSDVVGYLRMYGTAPIQAAADLIEADGAEITRLNAARDECGAANVCYVARIAELEALVREVLGNDRGPIKVTLDGRVVFEANGPWVHVRQSWINAASSLLDGAPKPQNDPPGVPAMLALLDGGTNGR